VKERTFTPLEIGPVVLPNRLVLAPATPGKEAMGRPCESLVRAVGHRSSSVSLVMSVMFAPMANSLPSSVLPPLGGAAEMSITSDRSDTAWSRARGWRTRHRVARTCGDEQVGVGVCEAMVGLDYIRPDRLGDPSPAADAAVGRLHLDAAAVQTTQVAYSLDCCHCCRSIGGFRCNRARSSSASSRSGACSDTAPPWTCPRR